jgi:hypothetical protein
MRYTSEKEAFLHLARPTIENLLKTSKMSRLKADPSPLRWISAAGRP